MQEFEAVSAVADGGPNTATYELADDLLAMLKGAFVQLETEQKQQVWQQHVAATPPDAVVSIEVEHGIDEGRDADAAAQEREERAAEWGAAAEGDASGWEGGDWDGWGEEIEESAEAESGKGEGNGPASAKAFFAGRSRRGVEEGAAFGSEAENKEGAQEQEAAAQEELRAAAATIYNLQASSESAQQEAAAAGRLAEHQVKRLESQITALQAGLEEARAKAAEASALQQLQQQQLAEALEEKQRLHAQEQELVQQQAAWEQERQQMQEMEQQFLQQQTAWEQERQRLQELEQQVHQLQQQEAADEEVKSQQQAAMAQKQQQLSEMEQQLAFFQQQQAAWEEERVQQQAAKEQDEQKLQELEQQVQQLQQQQQQLQQQQQQQQQEVQAQTASTSGNDPAPLVSDSGTGSSSSAPPTPGPPSSSAAFAASAVHPGVRPVEELQARLTAAIRKGKRIEAELKARDSELAAAQQRIMELTHPAEGSKAVSTAAPETGGSQQQPEQAGTPTEVPPSGAAADRGSDGFSNSAPSTPNQGATGCSSDDLQARLTAAIRRGKRVEGELKLKESKLAAAQERIAALEHTVQREAGDPGSPTNEQLQLQQLQEHLGVLRQQLQQREAQASEAQAEAEEARSMAAAVQAQQAQDAQAWEAQLQQQLQEEEAARQEAEQELQGVRAELASARAEVQAAGARLEESEAAVFAEQEQQAGLREQLQQALLQLASAEAEVQAGASAAREQQAGLSAEIERLQEALEKLHAEHVAAVDEIQQGAHARIEQAEELVAQAHAHRAELDGRVAELEAALAATQAEVSAAQQATAAAQAANARAERGERALVQSRQLLREAQAAADALQGEVLGLRIRVAELEQQAVPQQSYAAKPQGPAEARHWTTEHNRGPAAMEEAAREAKLLQGMVQALQSEAAQLRESHGMLQAELDGQKAESGSQARMCTDANSRCQEAQAALAEAQAREATLQRQLEGLQRDAAARHHEHQTTRAQLAELEHQQRVTSGSGWASLEEAEDAHSKLLPPGGPGLSRRRSSSNSSLSARRSYGGEASGALASAAVASRHPHGLAASPHGADNGKDGEASSIEMQARQVAAGALDALYPVHTLLCTLGVPLQHPYPADTDDWLHPLDGLHRDDQGCVAPRLASASAASAAHVPPFLHPVDDAACGSVHVLQGPLPELAHMLQVSQRLGRAADHYNQHWQESKARSLYGRQPHAHFAVTHPHHQPHQQRSEIEEAGAGPADGYLWAAAQQQQHHQQQQHQQLHIQGASQPLPEHEQGLMGAHLWPLPPLPSHNMGSTSSSSTRGGEGVVCGSATAAASGSSSTSSSVSLRPKSTRRSALHNQGGANSMLPYDVESGLPAADSASQQQQQQQQGAMSVSVLEQPSSVMTRLLGNGEAALAGENLEAENGGKPPMLPLTTWPPIKAAASKHPIIHTIANIFDRVWLSSSQLARIAPPPARVGLVSYLLVLHVMSWMELAGVWHHCP
ncbi:hypothetical protein DUNSADRAFT_18610 [Dunaliella salina]|nr:hypothetical protein DUNSADRAFT_18610 [Dunaliella salina]|eukprot:KAF5827866.1 hypothetical protein DUNSADRAFT_18610 [Dunaliella salina]